MDPKCARAVRAAAAGRQISDERLALIDGVLRGKAKELARADRERWQTLSTDQRTMEAANAAMEEIHAEAALKEYRAGIQVLRNAATDNRVGRLAEISQGKMTRSQSYVADLVNTHDLASGYRNEALANLKEVLDAASSTEGVGMARKVGIWLFDLDHPVNTADTVREVFKNAEGSTGNKAAQGAAKGWLGVIEALRVRFNAAGGNVGKLAYGYLSQAHDVVRVAAAGADRWSQFVLDKRLLDREQYVREDGSLMSDAEMKSMLVAAHQTIAEGGANKTEPGAFKGSGPRANRGSEHRVLHFKDGDAWMTYMQEFGEGSLYDAMIGHVSRMTRDLAIVERMGPDAEATHRLQSDLAKRIDAPTGKTAREVLAARSAGNTPDAYWKLVKGETGAPENRFIARVGSDLRNVQTAAKITWGPFSALADVGTILQQLHMQRIPVLEYLSAYKRNFDSDARANLRANEVIAESLTSTMNRWTGDNMTHSLTGRVTNAVMKVSLMNAWTDAGRNAFADAMMHNYTSRLGKAWGELDEWDRYLMERKGLTEADWSIITQAVPDAASPIAFLSAPVIRATGLPGAEQAAAKWGGYVQDHSQFAVVQPDLATRAIATGGGMPAGTFAGEGWRTFAQFKSFPMAMLTRHWRQALETPQGLEGAPAGFGATTARGETVNRIAVLAMLGVTTTILGAIQLQSRAILTGKDPIDPVGDHWGKFWAKAFAAGGGAGFLGDVLLAPSDDPSRQWQGHLGLLGPAVGAVGGLVDIAKDKHHAATAVRWLSDQLPGVDIWQVRAAYEHWFLHNAQELLNPGYLGRMRQRAQKDWGTSFWWEPGEPAPERAPDIGKAVGK